MDRDELIAKRNKWLTTDDGENDGFVAGYRDATADRDAALAEMRERVVDESAERSRHAQIDFPSGLRVFARRIQDSSGQWYAPAVTIAGQLVSVFSVEDARTVALALTVLAEIAEAWEREAAGEAASE